MYQLKKEEVCFRIRASERDNPFGIEGESVSGIACTTIEEVVTVPNIFTPDGDGINDLFRPVTTFTPSEYRLIIADRRRNTLFDHRIMGWDSRRISCSSGSCNVVPPDCHSFGKDH